MMKQKLHLFFGGSFSQWVGPLRMEDRGWVCPEQYMMHRKALLFGDYVAADSILATSDPAMMKAIGRRVYSYSDAVWHAVARDVVARANFAKFTLDPRGYFATALRATRGHLLVEASSTDVVWGVGLAENDPRALDPAQWRGTNWLGQVLTEVRCALYGS
jgi:ribA/ribD-fused uncharacterized protein